MIKGWDSLEITGTVTLVEMNGEDTADFKRLQALAIKFNGRYVPRVRGLYDYGFGFRRVADAEGFLEEVKRCE